MQRSLLVSGSVLRQISATIINQSPRCFTTAIQNKSLFKVQDDKDFLEKVENSKDPIIVDFFANWCGPCKALGPRLENVVAKRKGQISVAKVDIDDMGELAAKYEVSTIPTLVVFKNGKATERIIGLQDEDKLDLWVDKVMKD